MLFDCSTQSVSLTDTAHTNKINFIATSKNIIYIKRRILKSAEHQLWNEKEKKISNISASVVLQKAKKIWLSALLWFFLLFWMSEVWGNTRKHLGLVLEWCLKLILGHSNLIETINERSANIKPQMYQSRYQKQSLNNHKQPFREFFPNIRLLIQSSLFD